MPVNFKVWTKNPSTTNEVLQTKINRRKWDANCYLCQDGSINVSCKNDTVATQITTFLDMVVELEYQISDWK